ncbi:kinase-like domain-containing protein [Nemania sp. FL0916]|nr:kinase-like domain-containing protein [Nemania sp. FL0916]
MSKSSHIDVGEWKLVSSIHNDYTTHPFAAGPAGLSEGTWRRDDKLGKGGFGTVWKQTNTSVHHERGHRVRAVKQIRKTDKETLAPPELHNLIKLSTDRIHGSDHLQYFVKFFGWFDDQDHIYVSMEYIDNKDLQHHIQERYQKGESFEEREGAVIVAQISNALKFMHENNIMHRDLKPANILISRPAPDWQIKLADFGISKDIEIGFAQTKAGTDGYMAPEVADTRRKDPYTNAVDIWSLGAITFCIHTGRPPFENVFAIAQYIQCQDEKGAFPLDLLLKFSGKLVIFIIQLMDVKPGRRPTIDGVLQHPWVKTQGGTLPDQE